MKQHRKGKKCYSYPSLFFFYVMFVSLQIWPLFASKIIVSHICAATQLQQGKKNFVKIAFVLSFLAADRRRSRKSCSNFLTLIKGGQLVTFLQCQQKTNAREKILLFSKYLQKIAYTQGQKSVFVHKIKLKS